MEKSDIREKLGGKKFGSHNCFASVGYRVTFDSTWEDVYARNVTDAQPLG